MELRGRVESGHGDASRWLGRFNAAYQKKTGVAVFPGSLNLRIGSSFDWMSPVVQGAAIRFPAEEYGGERDIMLVPCVLSSLDHRPAFLWTTTKGLAEHPTTDLVEVITSIGLRETYGLVDGDQVILRLGEDVSAAIEPRVRVATAADVSRMQSEFSAMGWSKPEGYFASCIDAQDREEEQIWLVELGDRYAGHVRLVWNVGDPPAPEVRDLAVLPRFRRRGLASLLVRQAEEGAFERSALVRLAVGLHAGFGPAQRLYARLGYVPDGRGATREGRVLEEASATTLDDDLVLVLEKRRVGPEYGT